MIPRSKAGVAAIACVLSIASLGAGQAGNNPFYGRMAKPKDFDPPKTFANAFSIELPKDWQLVPGHTGTVFLVAEKTKRFQSGAAIVLDYQGLNAPFDPTIIDAFARGVLQDVQSRELSGSSFSEQVLKLDKGPIILIQYDRPSLSGGKDHVTQYSVPTGTTLYHLVCIAPSDELDRWRPIFAHVAASFTILKRGS
jgi:hypothetical protein